MSNHIVIKIPIEDEVKDIEDWELWEIYEYIAEEIMRVRRTDGEQLNISFKKGSDGTDER